MSFSRSRRVRLCMALLFTVYAGVHSPAQTLARPGWAGSGLSQQSWFRHAVFYRINARTFAHTVAESQSSSGSLKGIAERLGYIRDLGIDAILLDPLAAAGAKEPLDPALGTIDDFDELSLQASKKELRVLLTLPKADPALARFWLTRGVAGFYVPGHPDSASLVAIRKMLPGTAGQRLLITDADEGATGAGSRVPGNELQIAGGILQLSQSANATAAQFRAALDASQKLFRSVPPVIATEAPETDAPGIATTGASDSATRVAQPGHGAAADRLLGAVLLLTRAVPMIYAGQELGMRGGGSAISWGKPPATEPESPVEAAEPVPAPPPPPPTAPAVPSDRYVPYVPPARPAKAPKPVPPDPASAAGQQLDPTSVFSFYRQLIQLHHGRPSVRDGEEILLNQDAANALVLVRKPANASLASPPLVVLCNVSAAPLNLALKPEFAKMHLRGSFLRSPLEPGAQSVSMNLETINLPAYGVYVGDLRY